MIADDITSKYVPPDVNIFYCLGRITLTCFLVQVATGFAMTFYYHPMVTETFASIQYLMTEANSGWLIRSVHRWSASMMVLMMILHVFRVYLIGGFKKPHELTWVTSVVLVVLTASFWCDWLFLTPRPNWLLGSQNCNRRTGSYSCNRIAFGRVIARKC